jgi:hypothetical protein
MKTQRCSECHATNRADNRYCSTCGAYLKRELVVQPRRSVVVSNERRLMVPTAKQAGQAVAVSVAAFALEAGLSWLKRRLESAESRPKPTAVVPRKAAEPQPPAPQQPGITILRQRVVQIWRNGELQQQIVEGERTTIQ